MPLKLTPARRLVVRAVKAAALSLALAALATPGAGLQAQDANLTVLSVYAEDAGGAASLSAGTPINLVLVAHNASDATARNARVRVELRSTGVSFVGAEFAGVRTRELQLGDFEGRVSDQLLVPVTADARTASIDFVVTPLFDGQRGAPTSQTHRLPTGFPGAVVSQTPPSAQTRPMTAGGTTGTGLPAGPRSGQRYSREALLALPYDPARTIAPNESVSGTLGRGSALLDDGTPIAVWFYEGTAGERITITQTSSAFDSFMLFGQLGGARMIATDDDGGGGLNSRIRQTLPADGIYVIVANVLGENGAGNYSLLVESNRRAVARQQSASSVNRSGALGGLLGGAAANAATRERGAATPSGAPLSAAEIFALPVDESRIVRMGATVQGTLADGDLLLSDNTLIDAYYFNGFEGDRVSVTLRSRAFDAYLHFGELNGSAAIATDDDGGSGTDSRITVTLPRTGTYVILANVLGPRGRGAYTLEVRSP